jgi:hypothetical protein
MLRIANPGSDIDQFIRIFRDLYVVLKDKADFDLDDMSVAMVERGNVSSQGAFGEEALRRSTRKDRSRDPLYNQSKMYAELYRTLGWFQSTTGALRFAFSWMGAHAAETPDPKPLAVECLLGMAYPNDVLGAQSGHAVRVFPAILATAKALGGGITRDEMIVGPLSLSDDRDPTAINAMLDLLRGSRKKKNGIADAIAQVQARRGISPVTMGNYTRFPIAAVQWAGWAVKSSRSMLTITPAGEALIDRLATLRDVRLSDYKSLPQDAKAPFLRLSGHLMLKRAGFDLSPAQAAMDVDRTTLLALGVPTELDPWFSPFQQIARTETNAAFAHLAAAPTVSGTGRAITTQGDHGRISVHARVRFVPTGVPIPVDTETVLIERELRADLAASKGSLQRAVETFAERHARDNQDVFYPLVATLFRLVGFECRISRRGVNYDRADAMIVDGTDSIPIEIKSPGEEMELSVKALRQAVENKVILLSRKQFATRRETTTLAVGFNAPNERSDVRELIGDIHRAYGFNVGVLDLRALAALAITAILSGSKLNLDGFTEMKGVANVADILAP